MVEKSDKFINFVVEYYAPTAGAHNVRASVNSWGIVI